MQRRSCLAALAAAAVAVSCRERSDGGAPSGAAPAGPAPHATTEGWTTLDFPPTAGRPEPQQAELFRPAGDAALPLVVALHGRGEAGRGLEIGARAWRDDYAIGRMHERLSSGEVGAQDVSGWIHPTRLAQVQRSLRSKPYAGVALACPYTPALSDRSLEGSKPFAHFVTDELLSRARKSLDIGATRDRTGIDGVSMGGRLALWLGLGHPAVFGAVGALQPAIDVSEADRFADLAESAADERAQHVRLVSSDDDPFLAAVRALSKALTARHVAHELIVTPGPHDYAYNRGPGALELLLWHDRVLRGMGPP